MSREIERTFSCRMDRNYRYAHTPDALENWLKTFTIILPTPKSEGPLLYCFRPQAGDRDKTKRPLMDVLQANIVISSLSRLIIRGQKSRKNHWRYRAGVIRHCKCITWNRQEKTAIERAVHCAQRGDVILIAGKGHEDYQVVGKEKNPFQWPEVLEHPFMITR